MDAMPQPAMSREEMHHELDVVLNAIEAAERLNDPAERAEALDRAAMLWAAFEDVVFGQQSRDRLMAYARGWLPTELGGLATDETRAAFAEPIGHDRLEQSAELVVQVLQTFYDA